MSETCDYKFIVYTKNMAGDVISLKYNWDLRNKISGISGMLGMLGINDPWRVCILEMQNEDNELMISYLILDKVDIKLEYKLSFLSIMRCHIDKYRFYVIGGDSKYFSIFAASILAKEEHDIIILVY